MKKLVLVIFIATLSSVFTQDLALNCAFDIAWEYRCNFDNITVLNPSQNITIGGQHYGNRTNDDVRIVRITNSNTPFVIQQIFTTFRNIDELYIYNSNLQSIDIPNSVQLSEAYIYGNNITRLENRSFNGQSRLWFLNLRDNGIQVIEEDAFVGLGALESLNLIGNHIQELAPRTLHPLVNLTLVDFERNNLTRINDELFSRNLKIRTIYLEYNQIEEFSPRLIATLANIGYINLSGNVCVSRSFSLSNTDEFGFIVLHNALRTCYNNFIGIVSDVRRVTFEFEGSLKLYDEFQNLVASL